MRDAGVLPFPGPFTRPAVPCVHAQSVGVVFGAPAVAWKSKAPAASVITYEFCELSALRSSRSRPAPGAGVVVAGRPEAVGMRRSYERLPATRTVRGSKR